MTHDLADTNYSPTLMVGLGGTGIRAIRTIRLYGEKRADGGNAFDAPLQRMLAARKIVTLGIDTDKSEFEDQQRVQRAAYPFAFQSRFDSRQLQEIYPEIVDMVPIDRAGMNEAIELARGLARHDRSQSSEATGDEVATARLIQSFLNVKDSLYDTLLPPNNKISDGAGQLRALGRIGFLCSMGVIDSALDSIKGDIEDGAAGHRMHVCLISSLAGGTGSGMILDLAMMIRQKFGKDVPISGFFLLPEVFSGVSRAKRIWANSYAALKELSVLAIPNPPKPVHFNYRINGESDEVVLQAGDSAPLDDIYLFNEDAAKLDWVPDPELAQSARLEAASRRMADAALALSRRDLFGAEKSRQNSSASEGVNSSSSRRVYHALSAAHLLPLPSTRTANILLHESARKLAAVLESELASGPSLPDEFLRYESLKQILLKRTSDDDKTLSLPVLLHSRRDAAGRISKDDAFRTELQRMMRKFEQKNYLEEIIRKSPRGVVEGFRNKLKSIKAVDGDLASQFDKASGQPIIRAHFSTLLAEYFRPGLREFERTLDQAVDQMNQSGRPLNSGNHRSLEMLLAALNRPGNMSLSLSDQLLDVVEFRCPMEFFQLRSALGAYPDDMQLERTRWIEKYSPGAIVDVTIQLVESLWDSLDVEIENRLAANGRSDQRSASDALDVIVSAYLHTQIDDLKNKMQEALEVSRRNNDLIRDKIRAIDEFLRQYSSASIYTKPNVEAFYQMMNPTFGLLEHLERQKNANGEDSFEIDSFRRRLEEEWSTWLNSSSPDSELAAFANGVFSRLASKLNYLEKDDERRRDNLFKCFHDQIWDHWVDDVMKRIKEDPAHQDKDHDAVIQLIRSALGKVQSFARTIIEFLMDRQEFELSRLGGSENVRKQAEHCRLTVFKPCTAPGETHASYVTVALPVLNDQLTDGPTPTGRILTEIRRALEVRPQTTAKRSEVPMILYENRYHAAFQIRWINKYRRYYSRISPDEIGLYHTIPGAENYPEPISGIAMVDGGASSHEWICKRHEDGDVIESENATYCRRCMSEYLKGTRRYCDISRQLSAERLPIPGVDKQKREDGRVDVPIGMEEWFWDGVPLPERDVGSAFDEALRNAAFIEPLDKGWLKGGKPRHFTFPAVSAGVGKNWEWVARGDNEQQRFVRFDQPDHHLHECHHCGFPIDIAATKGNNRLYTCPRCRRDLKECFFCGDNDGRLFQPLEKANKGPQRCPRCTNVMGGPIEAPG